VGLEVLRNVSREANGVFKDSDWDDDARQDTKMIYSESDCRIEPSYTVRGDVDLKISDWVNLPSGFDLRPVVGFRWQRFSFVTHDGVQSYPAPGDTRPPESLPGDGIAFEQVYRNFFVGVKMAYAWQRPPWVSHLAMRMQLDWAYVTADNEDRHLLRAGKRFTYETTQGNGWHALVGLDVGLTQRLSATLEGDYLRIQTTGTHRLVNSTFGQDSSFDHRVEAFSEQASLTLGLKYAF
jgi:outer membrane protease